jgi:hypothetical protein
MTSIAAGKSTSLPAVEDYFKNTFVKEITPGVVRQMAIELFGGVYVGL